MLLYVTGSSCAGKTTSTADLAVDGVVVHDSDEVGVPDGADAVWRQRTLEDWVALALAEESADRDVLLTGQSPLGEVLAAPSAPRLAGIAVLLLDVADRTRWRRMTDRNGGDLDDASKRGQIGWGRWHREHADDPRFVPEAITASAWPRMRWDRWASWSAEDPRWAVTRLDTTDVAEESTRESVRGWVRESRAAVRAGTLPLRRGWDAADLG